MPPPKSTQAKASHPYPSDVTYSALQQLIELFVRTCVDTNVSLYLYLELELRVKHGHSITRSTITIIFSTILTAFRLPQRNARH